MAPNEEASVIMGRLVENLSMKCEKLEAGEQMVQHICILMHCHLLSKQKKHNGAI